MARSIKILLATWAFAGLVAAPIAASGHQHTSTPGAPQGSGTTMPGMNNSGGVDRHEQWEAVLADTAAFGEKGDPSIASRTVNVTMTDNAFSVKSLGLETGQTVRFVIFNKGKLTHEFTIGDAKYEASARKIMKDMADMGTDPASAEHAKAHGAAGNSITVVAGGAKAIVWKFTKPGTFEFACNVPGHAEGGMKGTISVK